MKANWCFHSSRRAGKPLLTRLLDTLTEASGKKTRNFSLPVGNKERSLEQLEKTFHFGRLLIPLLSSRTVVISSKIKSNSLRSSFSLPKHTQTAAAKTLKTPCFGFNVKEIPRTHKLFKAISLTVLVKCLYGCLSGTFRKI